LALGRPALRKSCRGLFELVDATLLLVEASESLLDLGRLWTGSMRV
jgi:hypothetical protein